VTAISAAVAATAIMAGAAVVMLVGSVVFSVSADRRSLTYDRMLGLGTPFVFAIALSTGAMESLSRPYDRWDEARFAMTLAISQGIPLYSPPDQGAQLPTIYGPVAPLVYLPATLATRPDVAMVIAGVIAQACFFAPIAWLCFWPRVRGDPKAVAERRCFDLLLLSASVFVCTRLSPLHYSGFRIHVDAPALGFAGLACLMVSLGTGRRSVPRRPPTWMLVAALLATLAVFSKQTLAPLLPALVIHVWVSQGLRAGIRFAGVLAIVLGCLAGFFVWTFGFREMAFHTFVIPTSHPLTASARRVINAVVQSCVPFASVPLMWWIAEARFTGRPIAIGLGRSRWQREPWILFCLTALCCLPTAALAFAKEGGDVNNWSLLQYFLLLACLSAIRPLLHGGGASAGFACAESLLLATTLLMAIHAATIELPLAALRNRAPNRTGAVYDYCRANPGQIYFAWHPAAVLAAEGELYHFYYALFDRDLAGHPVSPAHLAAHMPPHATMVVIEDLINEEFLERAFKGFGRRANDASLPAPLRGTILEKKVGPGGP
jgi:uncharacterized membrane protein